MEEKKLSFRETLATRQKAARTLVCVGLDPLLEKMPANRWGGLSDAQKVYRWMKDIVDVTAEYASMFKPQSAHWESIIGGREALQDLIAYIHEKYPDIMVFLDCKRGDIGRTQERYKIAHILMDKADGVNFSPYMGKDCMEFFAEKTKPETAIVGLAYTSNPSAREMQEVRLPDGRQYWEYVAGNIFRWSQELGITANAGLVMAAAYKRENKTYAWHLWRGRRIVGDALWFLIPGIGTQGGYIEETIEKAYAGPGSVAINSSSEIIFASQEQNFALAAGKKARELQNQINVILGW